MLKVNDNDRDIELPDAAIEHLKAYAIVWSGRKIA